MLGDGAGLNRLRALRNADKSDAENFLFPPWGGVSLWDMSLSLRMECSVEPEDHALIHSTHVFKIVVLNNYQVPF